MAHPESLEHPPGVGMPESAPTQARTPTEVTEHRNGNAILEEERIAFGVAHARRSADAVDGGHEALHPLDLRQHLADVDPDHVRIRSVGLHPGATEKRPQTRPRPQYRKRIDVPVRSRTLGAHGDLDPHVVETVVARVEDGPKHRLRTLCHARELALTETAGMLNRREKREVDVLVGRHELEHYDPKPRKNVVRPDIRPERHVRGVPGEVFVPNHEELLEIGRRPILTGLRGGALDRDARDSPLPEEVRPTEPRLELLRRPVREEFGRERLGLVHELTRGLVALHRQESLAAETVHHTTRKVAQASIPQIHRRKRMQLHGSPFEK